MAARRLRAHRAALRAPAGRGGATRLDASAVEAKWGVPPERLVDVLALKGDSVDNVPGVPLVGPPERVRDRLQAWENSDVTTLMVGATDKNALRQAAELVLG